jgi:L-lactate dehydrogenase complex protein LldF
VCPVKIDIPRLLLHLRSEISANGATGKRSERLAFKFWAMIMMRPWLYEKSAGAGRIFQRWFKSPLKAWTKARDLRPIEAQSFRALWRQGKW